MPSPVAAGRHWFEGDAFATRFLEALSLLAPEAERFFIGSVRDCLDGIGDPLLRARCRDFIREEGAHSIAHRRFNERLLGQGVEPSRVLRPVRALAAVARRWLPRSLRLAVTAGGEHISAILSQLFLDRDAAARIRDPGVRALFLRHALEELGHRAVAFDLLRAMRVGYAARIGALVAVTLATPLCVAWVLHALLAADAPRGRWRLWRRGLPWLAGLRGGFAAPRALAVAYARYFRPSFHPGGLASIP